MNPTATTEYATALIQLLTALLALTARRPRQ